MWKGQPVVVGGIGLTVPGPGFHAHSAWGSHGALANGSTVSFSLHYHQD